MPPVRRAPAEISPLLLTVEQAAEILVVSRDMIYKLFSTGQLGSIKIGALRRVPVADLEQFVAQTRALSL